MAACGGCCCCGGCCRLAASTALRLVVEPIDTAATEGTDAAAGANGVSLPPIGMAVAALVPFVVVVVIGL